MKKLFKHLGKYKLECVLGPLFKLLEACFDLLVPVIMTYLIDEGINKNNVPFILKMGGVLLALAVVGYISCITAQYFCAKAATGFSASVRQELYEKMEKLSFSSLDELGQSTLMTRLTNDIQALQNGVNLALRLFLRSPFIILGAAIMATVVSKSWIIGVIFAGVIIVAFILVFAIMLWTIPKYKVVQGNVDEVVKLTRENLTGVRVVRAFSKEDSSIENYNDKNDKLTKVQIKVARISKLLNPIAYGIVNISIAGLLYVGANFIDKGILLQGAVIAIVNYMSQVVVELIKFADLTIQVTRAIASGDRVQAMLDTLEDPSLNKTVDEHIDSSFITFKDVNFGYTKNGDNALNNINLEINKGEVIGVIGGTGSGKSTLVSLLAGFYLPDNGELIIDGKHIENYSRKEIRNKTNVVLQKAQLFKGSIRDNMKVAKEDATDEEIWRALEISQSKEFVESKNGLDFELEQGARNLSGGQKQRLGIARGVLAGGDILVLDDSSSALDYATEAKLRKEIFNMKDKTIFLVSQRSSTVRNADKIIVLDHGNVVGFDSHDNLIKTSPVYVEIVKSQERSED
ncbi:MAG: ABC transporter ATP-binding protein/permease [Bacilli bacterium]|nr:ABC transporter ATP-binding protein/permease [Bacilli bacterium]